MLPVLPLAFTAAWISTAAAHDSTGLWAVGALLVLTGTLAGTVLVVLGTSAVRRERRHSPSGPRWR